MFGPVILHATLLLLSFSVYARDISFPPLSGIERFQKLLTNDDGVDITTGSEFSGLMTFANLPYANCFATYDIDAYDIAVMGAPFDTAVTARPGARFGPTGIRQGSRRMSPSFAWSIYTGENPYMSWAKIIDCGDAPLTFLDNTIALKQLEKAHKVVSGRKAKAKEKSRVPRLLAIGGDHTYVLLGNFPFEQILPFEFLGHAEVCASSPGHRGNHTKKKLHSENHAFTKLQLERKHLEMLYSKKTVPQKNPSRS